MPGKGSARRRKSEDAGESEELKDILDGELKNRRFGIRVDDELEITIIAGNELLTVKGRLLSMRDDIEMVDDEGHYIKVMEDWVVAIKVLKHNRPPPEKDLELAKKPQKPKVKKPSVDHAYN